MNVAYSLNSLSLKIVNPVPWGAGESGAGSRVEV